MAAGRGDFKRAFHVLLAFDVIEVAVVLRVLTGTNRRDWPVVGGNGLHAVEKLDDLGQVANAKDFDLAHHRGFRSILLR